MFSRYFICHVATFTDIHSPHTMHYSPHLLHYAMHCTTRRTSVAHRRPNQTDVNHGRSQHTASAVYNNLVAQEGSRERAHTPKRHRRDKYVTGIARDSNHRCDLSRSRSPNSKRDPTCYLLSHPIYPVHLTKSSPYKPQYFPASALTLELCLLSL